MSFIYFKENFFEGGEMKKTVVILVLLVFVSLGLFALKPRDCVNCGSNCCAGSCDVSSSCSQCFIYDCL